ncbi:hypothetical protein KI387_002906, partial [Taxus chinensis]
MATVRGRALHRLCKLATRRTFAPQSASEPALASSNGITNSLRAIACPVMQAPPVFNLISIRWKVTLPTPEPKDTTNTDGDPSKRKRPPADTSVLFPGRDKEHWLIVMEPPEEGRKAAKDGQIERYIKCLATVLGSREAAIKAMYSVSVDRFYGFGCQVSEDISKKIRETPGVWYVWQDSYVNVEHKDYGGEQFIDGKIVPRTPEREKLINGDPGPSHRNKRDRSNSVMDLVLDEERIM